MRGRAASHVNQAKSEGAGIVFIAHNAHHALSAGDRFAVLILWWRGIAGRCRGNFAHLAAAAGALPPDAGRP
jgi:ABC-type uncharacterized transport system ATPase subunit